MNPFRDRLDLYPRRSRQLAWATLAVHGLAAALIVFEATRFPALLVLLAAIGASAAWYWRRQRHGAHNDITRLIGRVDGTWRWESADGSSNAGEVAASSVCTTRVAILHLRAPNTRRRALILMPDSLESDDFRRLRARLRLTAVKPDQKGGRLV